MLTPTREMNGRNPSRWGGFAGPGGERRSDRSDRSAARLQDRRLRCEQWLKDAKNFGGRAGAVGMSATIPASLGGPGYRATAGL